VQRGFSAEAKLPPFREKNEKQKSKILDHKIGPFVRSLGFRKNGLFDGALLAARCLRNYLHSANY
jgi:hypothetical protein